MASCYSAMASSARGLPLLRQEAGDAGANPPARREFVLHFRELIVGAGRAGREFVAVADAHLRVTIGAAVSSSAGLFSRFANVFHLYLPLFFGCAVHPFGHQYARFYGKYAGPVCLSSAVKNRKEVRGLSLICKIGDRAFSCPSVLLRFGARCAIIVE